MSPGEVRKLLGGYAAGTLTEEERRTLFEAALTDQDLFNELGREQALKELLEEPSARRQLLAALEAKESWIERIRGWLGRPMAWAAVGSLAAAVVLVVVFVQRAEKSKTVLVAKREVPADLEMRSAPPAALPVPPKPVEQAQTLEREPAAKKIASDRAEPPAEARIILEEKAKAEVARSDAAMARDALSPVQPEPQVAGSVGGRGGGGGSAAAPAPAESKPQALSAMRATVPVPGSPPAKSQPSSAVEVVPAAPPPRVTEQITVTAEAPAVSTQKAAGGAAVGRDSLDARIPTRNAQTALREVEQGALANSSAIDKVQMIAAAARSAVPYKLLRADSKRAYAEVPAQTVFRSSDRIRVAFQPVEAGRLMVVLTGRTKPMLDKNVSAGSSTTLDVPAGAQKLVVTFAPRTARQRGATAVSTIAPLTYEIPIQREPAR